MEREWQPIETKPPWTICEERGLYTHDGDELFYFKATHWRPIISMVARNEAADRIEALEAEVLARRNGQLSMAARIEALEAVLREVLSGHPDAFDLARAVLVGKSS